MLVETANIFLITFILIGRPNFIFGATPSDHHHHQQQQQQQLHGLYLSMSWSIGLLVPVSLVLCWRNMTTEYSSPYKVGLIDVGTKFAQSRLPWSAIAYGKLNFRGTIILLEKFIANANLALHQSAQVIIQCGTRYVDFFFFVRRLDFRFGPFDFFSVFDSTCDLISDSTSKNMKAWYRRCFDSKPPNIPTYRPGDPGVFHSRCQDLWTHVTLLGLTIPDAKFL